MAKAKKASRLRYKRQVWGGFVDGRLHYRLIDTGFGGRGNGGMMTLAVYTSKAKAREHYTDVRAIEIRELSRPARDHEGAQS